MRLLPPVTQSCAVRRRKAKLAPAGQAGCARARAFQETMRQGRAAAAYALLLAGGAVWAGPPFLTDDPAPITYRHSEAYVFATLDATAADRTVLLPAAEFNNSPVPDVHLHIAVPLILYGVNHSAQYYGLGDIEVGVKYRFVQETALMPQIGVYPMAELPSGSPEHGLGNGRSWWKLPMWLQKSVGSWTTYGGGGYAVNHAPGMRSYGFGGWALQHEVNQSLTLGGELFAQGAVNSLGRGTLIANFGGIYTPGRGCAGCQILFSAGHSVSGERNTVAYLALYWDIGPQ
jgi:hypothetical protein